MNFPIDKLTPSVPPCHALICIAQRSNSVTGVISQQCYWGAVISQQCYLNWCLHPTLFWATLMCKGGWARLPGGCGFTVLGPSSDLVLRTQTLKLLSSDMAIYASDVSPTCNMIWMSKMTWLWLTAFQLHGYSLVWLTCPWEGLSYRPLSEKKNLVKDYSTPAIFSSSLKKIRTPSCFISHGTVRARMYTILMKVKGHEPFIGVVKHQTGWSLFTFYCTCTCCVHVVSAVYFQFCYTLHVHSVC